MALFAWMAAQAALTNVGLTVRAQTIDPNDLGRLYWPLLAPRVNVDSTKIAEIADIDFRPVADRREWNARGRLIPLEVPGTSLAEMVPIESYFNIDEKEVNDILNRVQGNEALFQSIVGPTIPRRTDGLASSNFRRLEIDFFNAWILGTITVRHPQGAGADQTVSLGYDTARYLNNTAWDAFGASAWPRFIGFMEAAQEFIGPVGGATMELATFKAIQADAPEGVLAMPLTRPQVISLIQDTLGVPDFRILIVEDSHDVFNGGSTATTRTRVWPQYRVAAMPAGFRIGSTYFAPVARSYDLVAQSGNRIDIRGNAVFSEVGGNGRSLTTECQLNALPVPNEQKVFIADASATP